MECGATLRHKIEWLQNYGSHPHHNLFVVQCLGAGTTGAKEEVVQACLGTQMSPR